MSYILLGIVVFSWGFSWYAITLQVDEAHALVSVAHRFILAATVMCGALILSGRFRLVPLRQHGWLAGLGFCLFSMNFVSFYIAAEYLPSGLLSVIFATAVIFAALNQWIFFGRRLEGHVILSATMGIVGLVLLLGPEIEFGTHGATPWWAFALPFAGTYVFTIGNLISAKLSKDNTLTNVVGQGMIYGALICLVLCIIAGEQLVLPHATLYWVGVVYLALVASLLAFMTYLTLVNREGPAKASYATVLFPIVAMLVSTWAEGYEWSLVSAFGLVLALGGTFMTFTRRS